MSDLLLMQKNVLVWVRLAINVLFGGISGCCHVSIATMSVAGKEDFFIYLPPLIPLSLSKERGK